MLSMPAMHRVNFFFIDTGVNFKRRALNLNAVLQISSLETLTQPFGVAHHRGGSCFH